MTPDIELIAANSENTELLAWKPGLYSLEKSRGAAAELRVENVPAPQEIPGPWPVSFSEGWGAPPLKIFDGLQDWTEDPEEGIKYFSGTASYDKIISIPENLLTPDKKIYLDLGKVGEVAEVSLNGKYLGVLWKEPFRIDITCAAQKGRNKLQIKVTNLWVNRLAGDMKLPENKRFAKTNQRPYETSGGEDRHWRPLESGLMGPVRIITAKRIQLD